MQSPIDELPQSNFLDLLRQRGIGISVRDDRLQISAPTGAVNAELRAELVRRKPDLIEALREAAPPPRRDPLTPMDRSGGIPQTPAQQGMWLIDHFSPGNAAYNIPEAFMVYGAVDLSALQSAVDHMIERHETLRTRFFEEEGLLLQSVSPFVRAPVGFTDLSSVAEPDRDRAVRDSMRAMGRRSFDLACAPLVRFHLFRLAKQRHALFFNIHHIIADRHSLAILQRELSALYIAAAANLPAELAALPVQYADYAIWLSRNLVSGVMSGQIQYWKNQLAGAPPYLDLPFSRPYPEQRTLWGANVLLSIPLPLCDRLREIAKQESATMFMALMTALTTLLHKFTGKQDFCLGSPFTHRNHIETESLIGLFLNTIVFRSRYEGDPTFRECLRRTRTTALEAYEHSDVPFQEIVRALKPDLRSRRSPLFQIMFGFDADQRAGDPGVVHLETNPGTAKFDLTLQLREGPGGVSGWFEYCTDLFEPAAIENLSSQFLALLDAIVRQPDAPVSQLAMRPPIAPKQESGFWKGGIRKLMRRSSQRREK